MAQGRMPAAPPLRKPYVPKVEEDEIEIPVSLKPRDADQGGGGLIEEFDGTIVEARCVKWDYRGSQKVVPALRVVYRTDQDLTDEEYYSVGRLDKLKPAKDGHTFIRADKDVEVSVSSQSNYFTYITSICDHGLDQDQLDSVFVLEGMHGHFLRVAQKERSGLDDSFVSNNGQEAQRTRPKSILICTRLDQEAKQAPAPATTKRVPATVRPAKQTPKQEAADPQDLFAEACEAVAAALAREKGPLEIGNLGMAAYMAVPDAKYRAQLPDYCKSVDFLENKELPFIVEGNTIREA